MTTCSGQQCLLPNLLHRGPGSAELVSGVTSIHHWAKPTPQSWDSGQPCRQPILDPLLWNPHVYLWKPSPILEGRAIVSLEISHRTSKCPSSLLCEYMSHRISRTEAQHTQTLEQPQHRTPENQGREPRCGLSWGALLR